MATGTQIKWAYNDVINHCSKMTTAAGKLEQSHNNLKSALSNLATWQGTDAENFKKLMQDPVLSSLKKEVEFMRAVANQLKTLANNAKTQEENRSRSSNLGEAISAIRNRLG